MKIVDFNHAGVFDYTLVDDNRDIQIDIQEKEGFIIVKTFNDDELIENIMVQLE